MLKCVFAVEMFFFVLGTLALVVTAIAGIFHLTYVAVVAIVVSGLMVGVAYLVGKIEDFLLFVKV